MFKNRQNLTTIIRYFVCVVFLLTLMLSSVSSAVAGYKIPSWKELKDYQYGLIHTADESGFKTGAPSDIGPMAPPTLPQIVGQMVGIVLSLLGVIFMILIIYGGFSWMMARGNEEEATKAKDIIVNATIGVAIVFGAYAFSRFVIQYLATATNP